MWTVSMSSAKQTSEKDSSADPVSRRRTLKMRHFAQSVVTSGGLLKDTVTAYKEEMSTASPTFPSLPLTSDQITVYVASFSSLVFFVVIVVLLSFIYHQDPRCCKFRSSRRQHADVDAPPQYYSSRQTLVGSPCLEQTQITDDRNMQQAGQLFYVGPPSSYSLSTLDAPLPRLPSYESVRKKDRQRQIHLMIADRFGLNGPIGTEPPPTYEESLRQSVVQPYDIISSSLDLSPPQSTYNSNTGRGSPHPNNSDINVSVLPV